MSEDIVTILRKRRQGDGGCFHDDRRPYNPDGEAGAQEIERLRRDLAAAHQAILRAHTEAGNHEEMWLEEARQYNAERNAEKDRECCTHAGRFAKVIDVMQPVLGDVLRAERLAQIAKAKAA